MNDRDLDLLREKRQKLANLRVMWARRQEGADNLMRQIIIMEEEISQSEASLAPSSQAVPKTSLRYGRVRADIMSMLAKSFEGLDSVTVGKVLQDTFGDAISPRTHLTTLNRLKDSGLAIKVHGRWRLTAQGHRARSDEQEKDE